MHLHCIDCAGCAQTRGDAVQKPYTAKEQQHPAPAHVMPELSKLRQIVAKQIADAHRAVKTSQPTDSSHQTLSDALQVCGVIIAA
jgi:hypothetical protein